MIELSFNKPIRIKDIDLLENISRLTNLKSLHYHSDKQKDATDPHNYLKLSTLTNLEFLYFGLGRQLPIELLRYLPRMRQCDNMIGTEKLIQMINLHCPNYQSLYIQDDSLLSIAPISITELYMEMFCNTSEALTRLTNLKKQEVMCLNQKSTIDLRHVTWLEKLKVDTINVTGLEHSRRLKELCIVTADNTNVSTLLDTLTALHQLHNLSLSLVTCNVTLPSLSQLTKLHILCERTNVTLLPTSLQELDLEQTSCFELSDISHLVHLTKLKAGCCWTIIAVEPLSALTRLHNLTLNMEFKHIISLSTLVNLTYLHMSRVDLDPQTIKCLTHLEYLASYSAITKQAAIDNLQYLSHLTHLTLQSSDETGLFFDYKVIEKLPLVHLNVQMSTLPLCCWTVLPKLTTLEQLTIKFEDEENINSLTALSRLSRLEIPTVTRGVTCVGLTRLTSLQHISFGFSNNFSLSEMSFKLTRLIGGRKFRYN